MKNLLLTPRLALKTSPLDVMISLFLFDEFNSYIKETPHQIIRYRDRLGFTLYQKIAEYDFVVVHSMHPFWITVINSCPAHVVFIWVGYDYDDFLYQ